MFRDLIIGLEEGKSSQGKKCFKNDFYVVQLLGKQQTKGHIPTGVPRD